MRKWAAQWRGPGSQPGRTKRQGDSWFCVFGRLLICIDHGITAYYIIWKLWNSEAKIIKMGISHKHFVYIISLPELAWKKCKQTGLWFILVDDFRCALKNVFLKPGWLFWIYSNSPRLKTRSLGVRQVPDQSSWPLEDRRRQASGASYPRDDTPSPPRQDQTRGQWGPGRGCRASPGRRTRSSGVTRSWDFGRDSCQRDDFNFGVCPHTLFK